MVQTMGMGVGMDVASRCDETSVVVLEYGGGPPNRLMAMRDVWQNYVDNTLSNRTPRPISHDRWVRKTSSWQCKWVLGRGVRRSFPPVWCWMQIIFRKRGQWQKVIVRSVEI